MERVYLNCSGKESASGIVNINVFLKDVSSEHITELKGFLQNQQIEVTEFDNHSRDSLQEFSYFDDGFDMRFAARRWSFFRMRDYIHNYLDSWQSDTDFCSSYLKEVDTAGRSDRFDDHFYVELSKLVDSAEDRYYLGNRSISIFVDSILKILKDNLQLYWASAVLENIITGELSYSNHVPATVSKNDIISDYSGELGPDICAFPVLFDNDHIADFYIKLGPFSPDREIAVDFVKYVLMQIDDFIYGDIVFRKETYRLRSRIADLEKLTRDIAPDQPQETHSDFDIKNIKLLLLGDCNGSSDKYISEFKKFGIDKRNIEMRTEYKKMGSIDINNLKKIRSRYDGILLGPMPHKMSGDMNGSSLIAIMENNVDDYPPFVVVRDSAGQLKITKSSLKTALKELVSHIERYDKYEM
jgi:hypothetical protein